MNKHPGRLADSTAIENATRLQHKDCATSDAIPTLDVSENGLTPEQVMATRFRTFADILAYLMGDMSTRDLAERSGTSQSSVAKARGGLPPPLDHLPKWAKVLKPEADVAEDYYRLGKQARFQAKKDIAPLFREVQLELKDGEKRMLQLSKLLLDVLRDPEALAQAITKKDRSVTKAISTLVKAADAVVDKYSPR